MNVLLVLPLVIPLTMAAASLLVWQWSAAQRWLALVGTVALLSVALMLLATVWQGGILVTQLGNWPAPFGLSLVADLFSAIMVVLTGLMGGWQSSTRSPA
jgi:multicomponent Na+:H+ antiporter subunit D